MTTCGKCEAVLFDFDMTLADSSRAIHYCTNMLARYAGVREVPLAEVKAAIGLSIEDSWRLFWGEFKQEWLDYYRSNFRSEEQARISLFHDAARTVEKLRASGVKVGVASNRRFAARAVDGVGLAGSLDVVIGLEDVERAKPEPDCLIKGFAALGVAPGRGLYVGDADIDMKTALAAGTLGVGVTTGNFDENGLLAAGAWRVIASLGELPALISGLREEHP